MDKKNFQQFLNLTIGQKEVSLAIARNVSELKEFQEILEKEKFIESKSAAELAQNIKDNMRNFLVLGSDIKPEYDFIVQYPTGQIEFFDHEAMQPTVYSVEHQDTGIIFLVADEVLKNISINYNILERVGLTYRN